MSDRQTERGGANLPVSYPMQAEPGAGAVRNGSGGARVLRSWWASLGANTRRRDTSFAYISLFPAFLVIALLTVYPLIYSVDLAVHRNVLTQPNRHPYVGLENFAEVLSNPGLHRSLGNTLQFVFVTVTANVVVGVLAALLMNERFAGAKVLQVLILIPWAIPPVMAGIMWRWMFAGNVGVINGMLATLGVIDVDQYISFFGNPAGAKIALVVARLWKDVPLAAVLLLASLQLIPDELYDAAKIDGGDAWARFQHITLPFLRPALTVILILDTIISFVTFDLIFAMTGGGPADATTFVAWYTYNEIFTNLNLGRGAAMAFLTAAVTLALSVFYFLALRSEQLYANQE